MRRIRRSWLLVALMPLAGALVGWAVGSWRPVQYESVATMQVRPAQVLPHLVGPSAPGAAVERVSQAVPAVLSRTRLERLITELDPYDRAVVSATMQEVIEQMRAAIVIESVAMPATPPTFVVRYRGEVPAKVQAVTEKLMGMLISESRRRADNVAESTVLLLESRAEEAARTLEQMQAQPGPTAPNSPRAIRLEVARSNYQTLLTRLEDARLHVDMERRQLGEQLQLIDPARLPERPVGPTRGELALLGALSAALIALLVLGVRRVLAVPASLRAPIQPQEA